MKIAELAQRSGLSIHRLRRYESQGLLKARRTSSGHREFESAAVREAIFIAMGRDLGFPLDRLAEVLPLYRAGRLSLDDMVVFMRERIGEVDTQIAELRALRRRLVQHIGWLMRRQNAVAKRAPSNNPFAAAARSRRRR
jgi:MerR family transcriptional regulator, copper efflux regulator